MSGFDFSIDPYVNFESVLGDAERKKLPDPNAMALATVSKENKPSVRIVFFKGFLRDGFSFYTNYNGRKAQDINTNPNVSANFFWTEFQRQVRIEGIAQKTTRAESEAYFKTRARESQLGAWASEQSKTLVSAENLNQRFLDLELKYKNQDVPCPPHWGGYIIVPKTIEFWIGRQGRMHERYLYTRADSGWNRQLLNP